jgi:hypothetical protein
MKKPILATSAEKRQALRAILKALPGVSAGRQRERVLLALQAGPLTTFEASRYLDIYYPPVRVAELREQGHLIILHWVRVATESAEVHRVGMYALVPKGAA